MAEYTKLHKAFLQMCAHRGTIAKNLAIDALKPMRQKWLPDAADEEIGDDELNDVIALINEKLAILEQRLAVVHMDWELPVKDFVVFVNSLQTTDMKLPIPHTETECNYFKALLEAIFFYNSHKIPAMSALNACTSASDSSQGNSKKVTKQRAQELLDEWVANGYFSYVDDSYILGPRAIGEFGDMLIARFGDQLKKCFLCKNITFKANDCPNSLCDISLDGACAKKYLGRSKKCPKCKSAWTYAAAEEEEGDDDK